jgi:hypothetical protein
LLVEEGFTADRELRFRGGKAQAEQEANQKRATDCGQRFGRDAS